MKQIVNLHFFPSGDELPKYFYYQMEAFSRIVWGESIDDYDIDAGLYEPAQHFIVAQGKRLISYAALISVEVELKGVTYYCNGLASVMTFPAFRRRGYASQVVQAATQTILQSSKTDVGLLWTDPKNQNLYGRLGWEAMPHLITLVGKPPRPYDHELSMMLFVSERAKDNRESFEIGQLHAGDDVW